MNLVHAICDGCGQHATGTPQELHEQGWALNVGERSDELCEKCKSAPAPPVNEAWEF